MGLEQSQDVINLAGSQKNVLKRKLSEEDSSKNAEDVKTVRRKLSTTESEDSMSQEELEKFFLEDELGLWPEDEINKKLYKMPEESPKVCDNQECYCACHNEHCETEAQYSYLLTLECLKKLPSIQHRVNFWIMLREKLNTCYNKNVRWKRETKSTKVPLWYSPSDLKGRIEHQIPPYLLRTYNGCTDLGEDAQEFLPALYPWLDTLSNKRKIDSIVPSIITQLPPSPPDESEEHEAINLISRLTSSATLKPERKNNGKVKKLPKRILFGSNSEKEAVEKKPLFFQDMLEELRVYENDLLKDNHYLSLWEEPNDPKKIDNNRIDNNNDKMI